jgi:hypothetical protein
VGQTSATAGFDFVLAFKKSMQLRIEYAPSSMNRLANPDDSVPRIAEIGSRPGRIAQPGKTANDIHIATSKRRCAALRGWGTEFAMSDRLFVVLGYRGNTLQYLLIVISEGARRRSVNCEIQFRIVASVKFATEESLPFRQLCPTKSVGDLHGHSSFPRRACPSEGWDGNPGVSASM